MKSSIRLSRLAVPTLVFCGLLLAGFLFLSGHSVLADNVLLCTLLIGSIPLIVDILEALKHGHFGVDLIAIVAIITSLILGEYLAGTVILLMLSGGEALEDFAIRRARRELTSLVSRAPQIAHRLAGTKVTDIPVDDVSIGDRILVKPGEVIPVDGQVESGGSMVDESALTGESLPQKKGIGQRVMSGSIASDGAITIRALALSSESKYAQIIRLVEQAEENKAPFVRLADRYSVWFTSIAFVIAGLAWVISGDPIRMLAVLVVATPCPLILATPIAFAAGISRAAGRGIIMRNGGVIEKLGEAKSFVFDKTGTITFGMPVVVNIFAYGGLSPDRVRQIASSLDQYSNHVLARALVSDAMQKNVHFLPVTEFQEIFGEGVRALVDGVESVLGRLSFLESRGVTITEEQRKMHDEAQESGTITVYIAQESKLIGVILFADTIRSETKGMFAGIKRLGVSTILMLTGDRSAVAYRVAEKIGLSPSSVRAECLPEDKVHEVRRLHAEAGPVVMVGDGINDAPALTAADVGIAMGAAGHTAASESGDIVIMVDDISRVGEALVIGHRVLGIAKESIFIGIGLSILLMIIASFGYIAPVIGALLQEVIDVVVILNALRVLLVDTAALSSSEH